MTTRKPSADAANLTEVAPPVVQQTEWIRPGTVITQAGTEYYVQENGRGGSLELIRLHDLKEGFRANVATHRIKPGRAATDEERGRVYDLLLKKLEEEQKYRPGALVKAAKKSKHMDADALYVITKCSEKTVSIVILGGTNTGAYINAPRALLTIIDPADVLK